APGYRQTDGAIDRRRDHDGDRVRPREDQRGQRDQRSDDAHAGGHGLRLAGLFFIRDLQQPDPGRDRRDSEEADERPELAQRLRTVAGFDEKQPQRQQRRKRSYAEMNEGLIGLSLIAFRLFGPIAQDHAATDEVTE